MIFSEIHENQEISQFSTFSLESIKIKFHEKGARRRPGDLKRHGISLVKQGFPASGRQGAKKSYLR